ncbi:MAG: hypothetical protein ABI650_09645, partial [Dokdonella sp.]
MAQRSPLPYQPTLFEHVRDAKDDEPFLVQWVKVAVTRKTLDNQVRLCARPWPLRARGPRVTVEELKRMRADPPMRRPVAVDDGAEPDAAEH